MEKKKREPPPAHLGFDTSFLSFKKPLLCSLRSSLRFFSYPIYAFQKLILRLGRLPFAFYFLGSIQILFYCDENQQTEQKTLPPPAATGATGAAGRGPHFFVIFCLKYLGRRGAEPPTTAPPHDVEPAPAATGSLFSLPAVSLGAFSAFSFTGLLLFALLSMPPTVTAPVIEEPPPPQPTGTGTPPPPL